MDRIAACGLVSPGSIPGRDNFFYIIEDKISLSIWRRQEKLILVIEKCKLVTEKCKLISLVSPWRLAKAENRSRKIGEI